LNALRPRLPIRRRAAYFIIQYKLVGTPRIERDAIYYTHRRQIIHDGQQAVAGDRPMKRLGPSPICNEIEMLAFLTEPADLEITIAGITYRSNGKEGLA
jgi:hypothetical protein